MPPLAAILGGSDDFEIQREAAWAISNATSGGREEQVRYLVSQNVIRPLCELFACGDSKMVLVALEAVENILRVGKADADAHSRSTTGSTGPNKYTEVL
jgi:hypothetical protein